MVKNPNMINLDQNFDGIVDEPEEDKDETPDMGEGKPEEDKDETPDSGEEKPEEDKDETPDSEEEKPEEDKDETLDSKEEAEEDKEDDSNVNSPQTGEASVVSYSVLGIIAAAVLSLINRRKIK